MNTKKQDLARDVVRAMGRANQCMIDLYHAFRKDARLMEVVHGADVRSYRSFTAFECYVEVDHAMSHISYCWWLELRLEDDDWHLERSILKTWNAQHDRVQDVVKEFPACVFSSTEELLTEWDQHLRELCESATTFAF